MGNNHSSSRSKHGNGTIKLRNKKSKQHLSEREEKKEFRFHLPKDNQDIDRMQLQHFLFEHLWNSNYSSPIEHKLKLGGSRILDAGCGPGAWLLEMSTQHPLTRFFGVDIAKVFPTEIKPTNLEFRQCDMIQGLPFSDNYFDFVRMSLMLTSFKANQWDSIIRELVRVLKPGGYLELVEKELQAYNTGPHFEFMIKNIMSFTSSTGLNIYITRQIPTILHLNPSLTNIQSEDRIIPIGPLGGKNGVVYEELLEIYFKNKLIDVLPKFMNITEDEYLALWEKCQLEFTTYATSTKLFRFWAQKIVDDDNDNDNNNNNNYYYHHQWV